MATGTTVIALGSVGGPDGAAFQTIELHFSSFVTPLSKLSETLSLSGIIRRRVAS